MKQKKQKSIMGEDLNQSFRVKTEKAIQLINKHEEKKYSFFKHLQQNQTYLRFSPTKEIQAKQTLISINEIIIDRNIKIQLLPNDDLIYKILNPFHQQNMQNIKGNKLDHFKTSLTPALEDVDTSIMQKQKIARPSLDNSLRKSHSNHKELIDRKIKVIIKNYRGSTAEMSFYFEGNQSGQKFNIPYKRYTLTSQKIIHINLDDFTNKKWIYLRLKTKDQLTLFTIRIESQHSHKKRFITDISEHNQTEKHNQKLPQLKSSTSLKSIKSTNLLKQPTKILIKPRSQSLKLINFTEESKTLESPSSKIKNKLILQKLKKQETQRKKEEQNKKLAEVYAKKNAVQKAKEIELKLKSKALHMKKLVQEYKIIHEEENKKTKILQPKIAALIFLAQFNKICHQMNLQRQKGIEAAWKIRALTRRFVRIMRRKYRQSLQAVRNKKTRQLLKIRDFSILFGQILYKNSLQKSFEIGVKTIEKCKTGLIVNQVFDHATSYRRSIRLIQKTWLSQYNAKMCMFQMYIKEQAQMLIKKYPHFKNVHSKFLLQNIPHQLSYRYISQESSKIHELHEQYRQRLKQIEQFKLMNRKIQQFNKTALKKRQKEYLEVPKTPCRPSPRYFRNMTYLKSMIRDWFELECRKWSKLHMSSVNSVGSPSKKSVSPQRPSIKTAFNSLQKYETQKTVN